MPDRPPPTFSRHITRSTSGQTDLGLHDRIGVLQQRGSSYGSCQATCAQVA